MMFSVIQVLAVGFITITVILVGVMPIYAIYLSSGENKLQDDEESCLIAGNERR